MSTHVGTPKPQKPAPKPAPAAEQPKPVTKRAGRKPKAAK